MANTVAASSFALVPISLSSSCPRNSVTFRSFQRLQAQPGGPARSATVRPISRVARPASKSTWAVRASSATAESAESISVTKLKEFLQDLQSVGRVRLIVNTGLGVLESVTTLEGLFYHPLPGKGEYANVIKADENVDFHLLLNKIAAAKLATGKSRAGDFDTHVVRFMDAEGNNGASVFVMWKPGTAGDYDPGQVDGFKNLLEKYGDTVSFTD